MLFVLALSPIDVLKRDQMSAIAAVEHDCKDKLLEKDRASNERVALFKSQLKDELRHERHGGREGRREGGRERKRARERERESARARVRVRERARESERGECERKKLGFRTRGEKKNTRMRSSTHARRAHL